MEISVDEFAKTLKELRKQAGLTQTEAAKRLKRKSQRSWAQYEDGSLVPTISKAQELLNALG
jgi:transcriptional regulator with XRE-family HTH domain